MDTEVLFVILFLIFISVIAYIFIFSKCNCSCGVREEFSGRCPCAHGTGSTSRWYCRPGSRFAYVLGGNDYCASCDNGSVKNWVKKSNGWSKECPAPPPQLTGAGAGGGGGISDCRSCEDNSRERYGTGCPGGYPTCQDIPSSYTKTNKTDFVLGNKVEVSNQNCDWQETTDTKKIKRYDDKLCSNATAYIDQYAFGGSRGTVQAMTIKDLTNYCNTQSGCYGWARNNQQGDHKVKLCKKNANGETSLNNNSHYDVYTCNSDYVCPAGYELISDSSKNKYECSICPEGKYKSGKNANNCVPCKSSCPAGKQLGGTCPSGSTSDTKTCTNIPQDTAPTSGNAYTEVATTYSPSIRRYMGSIIDSLDKAKDKCNEMGDRRCGAIYRLKYPSRDYYFSVTREQETAINNGHSRSPDNQPYWRGKYVKN